MEEVYTGIHTQYSLSSSSPINLFKNICELHSSTKCSSTKKPGTTERGGRIFGYDDNLILLSDITPRHCYNTLIILFG